MLGDAVRWLLRVVAVLCLVTPACDDGEPDGDGDADTDSDVDADADGDSDSDSDSDADADPDVDGDEDGEVDAEPCEADCGERLCGWDPVCGTLFCGTCGLHEDCTPGGACECVPDCAGRECGGDGCGGTCGTCEAGFACGAGGV